VEERNERNGEVLLCENDFVCELLYTNEAELNNATTTQNLYSPVDTVPCTIMQVRMIQDHEMRKPLLILFDPGSTKSYIKQSVLPPGATPRLHRELQTAITLSGESKMNRSVILEDIILPEFTKSLRMNRSEMWVFNNPEVKYDAIIGRDLLHEMKIDICYSDGTMKMEGRVVLMKKRGERPMFYVDNDHTDEELDELYAAEIKEAKYDKVHIDDVIQQQHHLSRDQKQQLRSALNGYDRLFDGKLKKFPGKKIHLDVSDLKKSQKIALIAAKRRMLTLGIIH
jgi:hypothetical protein